MERRTALKGAVAAIAVSALPPAAMADIELIELAHELEVAEREFDMLPDDAPNWDEAYDRCSKIVERIAGTDAEGVAGLRAKAKAVRWCYGTDPIDFEEQTTDMRLAGQIVRALLNI